MAKLFDVIVIGGSTKDIFLIGPDFKVGNGRLELVWGEKFVVDDIFLDVGGGGANAAVSFARMGLRSVLLSQVGDDVFGRQIRRRLDAEGVGLELLRMGSEVKTSTSVLLAVPGADHAIVMYRGKNDDLRIEDADVRKMVDGEWVYITDLAGESGDLVEKIAAEVKSAGVKIAFIPGQHQLERGIEALGRILENTDCFILNLFEASQLLGKDITQCPTERKKCAQCLPKIKGFLRQFNSLGSKTSVITRDICGVDAFDGRSFYYCPAPQTKVVDTTGAGDAFASGFVAGLVGGAPVEEALKLGTKNAGSVILKWGAQTGLIKR